MIIDGSKHKNLKIYALSGLRKACVNSGNGSVLCRYLRCGKRLGEKYKMGHIAHILWGLLEFKIKEANRTITAVHQNNHIYLQ